MRSWIVTAALGLAALGLTTVTPATAKAGGRIFVGVSTPSVAVTYGGYYAPPPVVVTPGYPGYPVYADPGPIVVTSPPVVVTSPPVVVYRTPRYYVRPRVYVRGW
jgi:hypothetical protein